MAEAAAKRKTLLEEFMAGCKKGFYIGVENIMPAMVLAYALILFLNLTGLMDLIATAVAPHSLPKLPVRQQLLRYTRKVSSTLRRQLFCSRRLLPWARWLATLRAAY